MKNMKKRLGLTGVVALAGALSVVPTPAFATTTDESSELTATSCDAAVQQLLEANGESSDAAHEYTCAGGQVSVVVAPDSASAKRLSGEFAPAESGSDVGTRAVNCNPLDGPTRVIVSELEDNIDFCVIYGQEDSPTNGTWSRSIIVEWNMYPGWNSAQNQIRTIPSEGSPTLSGTVSSRKQNGILLPTTLATSAWSNTGNTVTTGWNVGGLTSGGSHSVAINDLEVTDPTYGFNNYIGNDIPSHRFECDTEQERCAFPNGQEAPL